MIWLLKPAAFRRLSVETPPAVAVSARRRPAAFRRLSVETILMMAGLGQAVASRLQAAEC